VREKRGSTWITVAPRSLALSTKRKPTGWFSAMLAPMMTMQSLSASDCWVVVAPPRPSRAPRPGTVEECQIRAWFSTATMPSPAVKSFLIR
jgi:hypothetical protein